jgi:hypothetical protein
MSDRKGPTYGITDRRTLKAPTYEHHGAGLLSREGTAPQTSEGKPNQR